MDGRPQTSPHHNHTHTASPPLCLYPALMYGRAPWTRGIRIRGLQLTCPLLALLPTVNESVKSESIFKQCVPVLGCLLWGRVHRLPCLWRCRWLERQEPESTSQSRRKPRGTKSSRAAVLESFSHRAWDLRVGNSLRVI